VGLLLHLISLVSSAYPMGLPEWDTIRLSLGGTEGLEGTQVSKLVLDMLNIFSLPKPSSTKYAVDCVMDV